MPFSSGLYKLYNNARLVLNVCRVLSPYPSHGPVNFVSPLALSGPRPEEGGGALGTYHGAAEGPEPPEESQGQEQEQDQQGDRQDGAIGLQGQEKGGQPWAGHVRNKPVSSGRGKATPVLSPSHRQYADLRPEKSTVYQANC